MIFCLFLLQLARQRWFAQSAAVLLFLAYCLSSIIRISYGATTTLSHEFKCTPQVLAPGEPFNIELGVSHPGELAIVRPDGEYFFIAQRVLGNSIVKAIPSEIFRNILALRIIPSTFVAHKWRAGAPDYELVFNMAGKYKVILGESLESNIAGETQVCEVTFRK